MNTATRQSIPVVRDDSAALFALFDALLALPHATCAVLWTFEFPQAAHALRQWCEWRDVKFEDDGGTDAGHTLRALTSDYRTVVSVRLDNPWASKEPERSDLDVSQMWSPAHGGGGR